jgi:hypothetical protein
VKRRLLVSLSGLVNNHRDQLRLAFRAGAGSVFFMIIYYFFRDLRTKTGYAVIESLVGIFLTFIIIVAFLDPLKEFVRKLLPHAPQEVVLPQQRRFWRVMAGVIMVATGICTASYTRR